MADRVRRPVQFEVMLNELRDKGIFKTYKDALVFSACLGKKRNKRVPFAKSSEPVHLSIFSGDFDKMVINSIAVAEDEDAFLLSEEREDEKIKIFEEYACGGLEILKNEIWDLKNDWEKSIIYLMLQEEDTEKILTDITMLAS
jgi:dnd system-associated protein 4